MSAVRDPLRSFIGIPRGETLQEANKAVLQVRIFCKATYAAAHHIQTTF